MKTMCSTQLPHLCPHHGVGLARASLPIGKHAGIVPLEGRLQDRLAQVIEYLQT